MLLCTTVTLGACESAPPPRAVTEYTSAESVLPDSTFMYECEGGAGFVAALRRDTVWAFLPSGTVALPRVGSASGAKFSDGEVVFWSKGPEVLLESPADTLRACRNNGRRAVWEHAKLSGVDFRAVGNEPGWHMDMRPETIILVTDYGERRYEFPIVTPEEDDSARTSLFQTEAGGVSLTIRLRAERCLDTMVDDEYETTVELTLDGRVLHGCGRALH
jgi:uncharacterized membrane protein/membrane-bound inhibitor of C-type lysozyme